MVSAVREFFARRGVYRLSLGRTPVDRVVIKTNFYPDNTPMGHDGFLYVAGPAVTSRGMSAMRWPVRPLSPRGLSGPAYKVLRIALGRLKARSW